MTTTTKTNPGNYFEDFELGQVIRHATPRTVTHGDVALYIALYGPRFVVQSSEVFARAIGYAHAPLDDMLVFHVVFGKTVPDVSLNAIANLGYADCRFLRPVFAGETLQTTSEVIGLKQNSNGETGVVWVRSTGFNQADEKVLDYVRWVLVRKKAPGTPGPEPVIPELPGTVDPSQLGQAVPPLDPANYDTDLSGQPHRFGDFEAGEKIDHVDAMTIEDAEHQMAARLYQNTAKVHFNAHTEREGRFGKRIVYGGHIISLARALSYNGLANAFHIAAINGGRHTAPSFAGDTIYAWSEILDTARLPGRDDVGALRVRTVAVKDRSCEDFPHKTDDGKYAEGVVLELDYWALVVK